MTPQSDGDLHADTDAVSAPQINISPTSAHWDFKYEKAIKSAFTANLIVQRELNQRMTGDPRYHWLNWFFEKYISFRPASVLSIGCGDGAHEFIIARNGYAGHVTGFDASTIGVANAKKVALEENLPATFEVMLFEDFVNTTVSAKFDLVLFAGSLHHVRDIEGMLFAVQRVLQPDGLVLVNEYIGPAYQLYAKRQIDLINTILRLSPPDFLVAPQYQVRLPTIREVYAADPTEGTRAPLIRPLLPRFFTPVFEKPFGGALLHSLFDGLRGDRINDGTEEVRTYVEACIALENDLTEAGYLSDDFLFACYRHPK